MPNDNIDSKKQQEQQSKCGKELEEIFKRQNKHIGREQFFQEKEQESDVKKKEEEEEQKKKQLEEQKRLEEERKYVNLRVRCLSPPRRALTGFV